MGQVSKEEMTSKTEEEKIDPILVGREKQARELGFVNWYRAIDFAVACKLAKEEGKALAILFTEIPGSTQETFDFGDKALSHPRIVELLEDKFVPVAIQNNTVGLDEDRRILKKFGEKSWATPVLRFVDPTGKDLVPRREGIYSRSAIKARAKAATNAIRTQAMNEMRGSAKLAW
uniref:Uncharacterized protein n=1 Tax=Lotharella globosa TaxID=91324 RepID=A0A6V3J4Q1_9EUKA|mmetsp:Transcript_7787/g.15201  ORF Transcript_7787/g.15201 Transcript_7787/m.15201 type:complete len:175 (-) Transcript_7787:246-770(-)